MVRRHQRSYSMSCHISLLAVLALSIIGIAAPANAATMSSCVNQPGSPTNSGGTLYTQFTCSLYNDASSYSIDLTPLMTQDGALLSDNVVGAGYVIVLNGDPLVVSAGDTNEAALFNQSLWEAVLFWPGDQNAGQTSDSLTVYWPTAFPAASVVQTFDENLYGLPDSAFFVQSMGSETVYAPYAPGIGNEYDIYVPEPSSLSLFGAALLSLAGFAAYRRRKQPLT